MKHLGEFGDDDPCAAWRLAFDGRYKYVDVERGAPLLIDTHDDPDETRNLVGDPAHEATEQRMRQAFFEGFSWDQVHQQLEADRQRLPSFASGQRPTTPNQYMLPDKGGRIVYCYSDDEGAT